MFWTDYRIRLCYAGLCIFLICSIWICMPGSNPQNRTMLITVPINLNSPANGVADAEKEAQFGKNIYSNFQTAAVDQQGLAAAAKAAVLSLKQQLEDNNGHHRDLDKLGDARRAVLNLRREWRVIQDQDQLFDPLGRPIRQLDSGDLDSGKSPNSMYYTQVLHNPPSRDDQDHNPIRYPISWIRSTRPSRPGFQGIWMKQIPQKYSAPPKSLKIAGQALIKKLYSNVMHTENVIKIDLPIPNLNVQTGIRYPWIVPLIVTAQPHNGGLSFPVSTSGGNAPQNGATDRGEVDNDNTGGIGKKAPFGNEGAADTGNGVRNPPIKGSPGGMGITGAQDDKALTPGEADTEKQHDDDTYRSVNESVPEVFGKESPLTQRSTKIDGPAQNNATVHPYVPSHESHESESEHPAAIVIENDKGTVPASTESENTSFGWPSVSSCNDSDVEKMHPLGDLEPRAGEGAGTFRDNNGEARSSNVGNSHAAGGGIGSAHIAGGEDVRATYSTSVQGVPLTANQINFTDKKTAPLVQSESVPSSKTTVPSNGMQHVDGSGDVFETHNPLSHESVIPGDAEGKIHSAEDKSSKGSGEKFGGAGDSGTSPVAIRTGYDKGKTDNIGVIPDSIVYNKDSSRASSNEIESAIGHSRPAGDEGLECRTTGCKFSKNLFILRNQRSKVPNTRWEWMFLLFATGLAIVLCFVVSFAAFGCIWAWRGQVQHTHYQAWNSSVEGGTCESTSQSHPTTKTITMALLSSQQASHEFQGGRFANLESGDSYVPGGLSEQPRLNDDSRISERTSNNHESPPNSTEKPVVQERLKGRHDTGMGR